MESALESIRQDVQRLSHQRLDIAPVPTAAIERLFPVRPRGPAEFLQIEDTGIAADFAPHVPRKKELLYKILSDARQPIDDSYNSV